MRVIALLLLLAACAAEPPPAPPQTVAKPVVVETCPAGGVQPIAPPAPRTVMQLADYANALRRALTITEDARTECAKRVNRLQEPQ